jgi:hypothetical protein
MMMYIKNRPALSRRAIWFRLVYPSTSKASPNDRGGIVIVIFIIVDKEGIAFHHAAL